MLVLASASPRRRELLAQAGFVFTVHPAHIPEDPLPSEQPIAYVTRLAREKAEAVYRGLTPRDSSSTSESRLGKDLTVLGADTTVTLDNQILAKPADPADASRMLRLLSGRGHEVTTAVSLASPEGSADTRCATTEVFFRELQEEEIQRYVAGGEPMDKAGAYAIQGGAGPWVERIEGEYSNVVGLPVSLVTEMLRSRGLAAHARD